MPAPRLAAGLIALLAFIPPALATAPVAGIWINPRGTVAVRAGPCRDRLCGWVNWASPQALADAREAGVTSLVGTELLQDYRPTGAGKWTGRVYVPDRGESYYSTIEQVDPNRLKISGCILHGLLCKSQLWRRMGA